MVTFQCMFNAPINVKAQVRVEGNGKSGFVGKLHDEFTLVGVRGDLLLSVCTYCANPHQAQVPFTGDLSGKSRDMRGFVLPILPE